MCIRDRNSTSVTLFCDKSNHLFSIKLKRLIEAVSSNDWIKVNESIFIVLDNSTAKQKRMANILHICFTKYTVFALI